MPVHSLVSFKLQVKLLRQAARFLGLRAAAQTSGRLSRSSVCGGVISKQVKMTEQMEKDIEAAQEAVTKQGDTVRSLKASLKDGKAEKAGSE